MVGDGTWNYQRFIDGESVADVTAHEAFRNSVASAASLYDFQAAPENIEFMTFACDGANRRANRSWQMPRSYAETVERRVAVLRRHADRVLADAERSVLLPSDLDEVRRKHATFLAVATPGAVAHASA